MKTWDVFPLMITVAILILGIGLFIRICIRLRKGGGSLTTLVLGATDEFLTKERNKAAETIVIYNAGKMYEVHNSKKLK